MRKFKLLFLFMLASQLTFAQNRQVQGTVVDVSGEPVIGATIMVDGTKTGAVTDIDGKFSLRDVPAGSTITVSYVGMKTQQVKVSDNMQISLQDDSKMLDEVVAIGYGSAKAKDLTSPIVVVKGDELLSTPSTSPMTALQGKVAGVNVVSSGAPGASPTVRIRGVGSFSNATPLYVVDGMFYDNIDFLNSSDIEDMSVLKDASAAAIYGVRAANGVVIITTKKGVRNAPAKITYDGYVGVQKATNVLKMANARQYASSLLEANRDSYETLVKASIDRYGGSYADSDFHNWTFGADTDWYDELLRDAVITNHNLSISGGGEKATYSVGMNYLYQNGIMDTDNDYKRMNFRAALDYDATNWLKVGFNGVFSRSTQHSPNSAAWEQAFNAAPIFPVYDDANTDAFPDKYASPSSIGFQNNIYNPVATANYNNSENKATQALTNFYAQFQLIPEKLNFRTSYSYDHKAIQSRAFTPAYYVSNYQQASTSSLTKSTSNYDNHIWDNTLTYNDSWGKHNFGAMAGFSMREENYRYLSGTAANVPGDKEEYMYLNKGNASGATVTDDGTTYRGMSWFGRINYNYDSKYYLMATFRADGSSKYQEHWGYFPSVGASWVISEEPWMKDQNVVNYLKLRASWGMLGNDHVAASDGFANITTGNGASGVFGNTTVPGYQNNSYFSYLKWERVEETNIGFNLATFNSRLNVDADYFHRMTKKAVISPRLPFDNSTLAGNYGKILNQGFDVSINWDDRVGKDFKYHIGTNLSFLWNEVKNLGGKTKIEGGKTVNIVGKEMNSFYGYKVIGVYQNQAEIDADPFAKAQGLEPGDFKYEDVNGDGTIDGNDKQTLGSYIPNFTFGVNFGFEWKGLDFNLQTYGQTGAQLFNRKRALRYASNYYNIDEDQYKSRWTGEGTSNSTPSAKGLMKAYNVGDQWVNSYLVESADFFRIQNVTLGYTFRKVRFGNYILPSLRLSITADRPCTFFSANSFTPELSDPEGWDTQVYPLAATYTFGLQIQF